MMNLNMEVANLRPHSKKLVLSFLFAAAMAAYNRHKFQWFRRSDWLKFLTRLKKSLPPMFTFDIKSKDIKKYGLSSPEEAWEKENPRKLVTDSNAVDLINVWGADFEGNVLMLRMARRPNRTAEIWIYLRLENGVEFQAPWHPDLQVCNTDGRRFMAKGLTFEVLEPLRSMRIDFNGQLRQSVGESLSEDDDEMVDIEFSFIWHPMFNYSTYPFDFNPTLMASTLSKIKLTEELKRTWTISSTEWHEQWGQLHGQVTIGDEIRKKVHVLMLTGTKTREYGVCDWRRVERKLVIKGMDEISTGFTLYGNSDQEGMMRFYQGQVAPPSGMALYSVSKCESDMAARFFDLNCDINDRVNFNVTADNRDYVIRICTMGPKFNFYAGQKWEVRGSCRLVKLSVNGRLGFGLVETYEEYGKESPDNRSEVVPQLQETNFETCDKLVLQFSDDECMSSKLVGGKGASVALMTSMPSREADFMVPKGVCLTKTCFERHMEQDPRLAELIEELHNAAWKRTKAGDLELVCQILKHYTCDTDISSELVNELRPALRLMFGDDFEDVRYAVRSSGVGEDGSEISAAGQNSSYIGEEYTMALETITKCWGSQFSFHAVEYKRNNGQLLNPGMGVVIQEVINAEVSGVLFTKDALNGSVAKMTIAANFGLGESVVSGRADPDTFTLSRSWDDQLAIKSKRCGAKQLRIEMAEPGGTTTVENSDEQRFDFSISDRLALQLGKVAIQIEKAFGFPLDIEWAVAQDHIYILQARPMTSDSVLTDFQVFHEFDTPFRFPNEQLSTGNVGEVMPGALSPLSLTTNIRAYSINFRDMFMANVPFRFDPARLYGTAYYTGHFMMDMVQQKVAELRNSSRGIMEKATDVGVFGRVLDAEDTRMMDVARQRYELSETDVKKKIKNALFKGVFQSRCLVGEMERKFGSYPNITEGAISPQDAYDRIAGNLIDIPSALKPHLSVTIASMIWNALVLIAAAGGDEGIVFSNENCAGFAALMASTGAESGDVPLSLQEVAKAIAGEFDVDYFSNLPYEIALHELRNKTGSNALAKFEDFLKRHGHRGQNEYDFTSVSWGSNQAALMLTLQNMITNQITSREAPTIDQTRVSMNFFKRTWLYFVLQRSKNAVRTREKAKSLLVKLLNGFRLAFRHLATLMVEDGLIPEADMMFYMSFDEIDQVIKTRSVRIIKRARRRMLLYPKMDKFTYPELMVGLPKPLPQLPTREERDELIRRELKAGPDALKRWTQVLGVPVCHGYVIGLARVIINLHDAGTISPKDILITNATDIGWSPYFPMLSGVVTEIGGLVSHGAVVAREYGLPCIIGARRATEVFVSGDRVELNANEGYLNKMQGGDEDD